MLIQKDKDLFDFIEERSSVFDSSKLCIHKDVVKALEKDPNYINVSKKFSGKVVFKKKDGKHYKFIVLKGLEGTYFNIVYFYEYRGLLAHRIYIYKVPKIKQNKTELSLYLLRY